MEGNCKLRKEKGVEIVIILLNEGKTRKEIVKTLTSSYNVSAGAIDKWIKDARPAVIKRQEEDEELRRRESDAIIIEAVKTHGVTKERVIARLAKIAFGDISNLFTVDGGLKPISDWDEETKGLIAGIESFDVSTPDGELKLGTNRKVKTLSPIEAMQELSKMLGYYVPVKQDIKAELDIKQIIGMKVV